MLKQNQLRFGLVIATFFVVMLMVGAYTMGTMSHGDASAAQANTPAADPHAGHGTSAATPTTDPHAGHGTSAATPTTDPHAGHGTTAATPTTDPHAGHGTTAATPTADPHAGHSPESESNTTETALPAAFEELVEEWETMQEHSGHGMVHPTDEHIEHMTSMLVRLQQVMEDASSAEHAAMHDRTTPMIQEMMPMFAEIMDEIDAMPAEDQPAHMAAALTMFEELTGLMAMMSSHSAHQVQSSTVSSSKPMSGTMSMQNMSMQNMHGMEMMDDMQGMMARMQGMMEEMHGSMPMRDMEGMMGRMQEMKGMMNKMGGMDKGDNAAADPHAGHSAADAEATPTADSHAGHHADDNSAESSPTADPHAGHGSAAAASTDTAAHDAHAGHGGPISSENVPDAVESIGSQPLAFTEEDGVKVFELTAQPVRWNIIDGDEPVTVTAWSYNGTVPGPMIRVTEGEQVRIVLTNNLPEATSIHWHGMPVPYEMDGMTPVAPGESFTYEFTAPAAGSYMYHSHIESDKQVMVGLYAPFIVEPAEPEANPPAVDVMWLLSEWRMIGGETYPAMPMTDGDPNYFTINGKAYPSTEKIVVKQGETVRIRIAGIGQFAHPMHLHGMNFRIVGYDGVSLRPEQQIVRNTVTVNPGEIVDIEFTADNLGTWMFHCHILHHVTNDGVEPGGLLAIVEVVE